MSDLKPQLMLDAKTIVQQHREDGGNLNELVAKYATDKGYGPKVVDSLAACVNRHSFKEAMQQDRHDEPAIASPAAVKLAQNRAQNVVVPTALPIKLAGARYENERCKSASVTTVPVSTFDYGPAVRIQLSREKIACESQVTSAYTEIRMGMDKLAHQFHLIKRLGLEKTAHFQDLLRACPGPVAAILDEVLSKTAAQPPVRDRSAIAMLVPQAMKDFAVIRQAGENLVKLAHQAGVTQARLAQVNDALLAAKGEVTANV